MTKKTHLLSVVFIGLVSLGIVTGCEHGERSSGFAYGDSSVPVDKDKDKDKDTNDSANNFVGTWKLSTGGSAPWYAFFYSGGNWKICDNADGSGQRVYGSYSVKGATLNGNMTNPGVGTGSISATISNGVMTFDFIEHWHNPYKTVRYTGSKL